MADLLIDRRELDFVLYEQCGLGSFPELDRYKEQNRELYDMILNEASRMATEHLAKANSIADREGSRLVDGQVRVPEVFHDLYKRFVEGGWCAVSQSPDHGGMGLPKALSASILEIFIAGCGAFAFWPGLIATAGHLIETFASDELKNLIVPRLYRGEWTGTMCLTEPQAGTAVGDLKTSATQIAGTERYRIKGSKIFITCGDHDLSENIIHLVLARVPGDPEGTKGISLFAVPKVRFDPQGRLLGPNDVTVTALEHKMGIRASPTCSLSFGENDECEGLLIGERSRGIVYMFQMMNEARLYTGLQGVAFGNAAYQLAARYAKERVQGSKTGEGGQPSTIVDYPDVRRNLLLAKAYAEGIRALLLTTSVHYDRSQNDPDPTTRSQARSLFDLLTPVCKAYATDMGFRVTELAMQVHGGYGYIGEYGVEQHMRDVKIASIYEGTNGIQALDLLGRKLRIKDGALLMTWLADTNAFLEKHAAHSALALEIKAVDDAKNLLAQAAFGFVEKSLKDLDLALVGATPFLEMFGHVHVARLLVEQAVIATEKLKSVAADSDDGHFYRGKIQTARFFIRTVLPHAHALFAELNSGDRSALEIQF